MKGSVVLNGFLSINEALQVYIKGCQEKSKMPVWKLFIKGVIAGIMIGVGAGCSSVAGHSITNVGLSRLAIAAVFPVGLMIIILLGAELFTGDCLAAVSVFDKKEKWSFFFKLLVVAYVGNFVGAVLMTGLSSMSVQWDYSGGLLGAYSIKVALAKVDIPFIRALCSGILCNVIVCATVFMAVCAKEIAGKLLAVFFGVFIFAVSGYEHCVANMYYITAGLLAKLNPAYVEVAMSTYGITAEQLEGLNLWGYVNNLVPVTLGNIIGGSLFIGAAVYYMSRSEKKK